MQSTILTNPLAIYLAVVIGAVGLWFMMPKGRQNRRIVGGVIAAAALGLGWFGTYEALDFADLGLSAIAFVYYYVFSAIAIVSAVMVITATKPVHSALWFVMVVLASAGLFLVLSAEFMAFAMIIIYAGAILVTYMFVIMLAASAGGPNDPGEDEIFDLRSRTPTAAVIAGFLMLAVLLTLSFDKGNQPNPLAAMPSDGEIIAEVIPNRSADVVHDRILTEIARSDPSAAPLIHQADPERLSNVEKIGLDLFQSHPLGIELAGVVLLVALIGAVVIAKTRVEDHPEPRPSGAAHPSGHGEADTGAAA
ncbi:MAG: NADH-quinone oxidoreductase subunit J [Planctomycetota bacterium]